MGFRRKVQMRTSEIITLYDLCSQGIELLHRRLRRFACGPELPLANRMHDFHAGNRTAGRPKGLEAEHGTRQPFHGPMVLFHEVIGFCQL